MIRRFFLIIILLSAISQMAVTCQGTETGNPGGSGAPNCPAGLKSQTTTDPDADQVVDDLILDLCQRIVVCGVETTIDTCFNALNGPSGDAMIDEFGSVMVSTIDELREVLQSGRVNVIVPDFENCEEEIDFISCSEVNNSVTPNDFSGVEFFIPIDCSNVFVAGPVPDAQQPGSEDGPGIGCP